MKHITEDIFNEAMNGLDPALVAEHISKREELESNKTRPARTYRLRRAAIAAVAAAAIAAGAAGAVFIANRAPEPGAVSEGSAGEAVNNSGENVSADDSGESDPDLPGTSSAESGPEALPSPYVNGVFFPYIYVDNLFHDMDVIKMYVQEDYDPYGLYERGFPTISVLSANGEDSDDSGDVFYTNQYGINIPIKYMSPDIFRPREYFDSHMYISCTLACKLKYFENEERYAVLLFFPVIKPEIDLTHTKEEIVEIVEQATGEPLELKPVIVTNPYSIIDDEPYRSDEWFGTLDKEQILALADQHVMMSYVCSVEGERGYLNENYDYYWSLIDNGMAEDEARYYLWYNQLVINQDEPGEELLKALNEWNEYHGDCVFATEEGLIYWKG